MTVSRVPTVSQCVPDTPYPPCPRVPLYGHGHGTHPLDTQNGTKIMDTPQPCLLSLSLSTLSRWPADWPEPMFDGPEETA